MTSSSRDVTIKVGKNSYSIKTTLDDDSLGRISSLLADAAERTDSSQDQEKVLLILCLQLAWALEKTLSKLEAISEELEKE
ncbi:MAG: hypothetical protein GX181_00680 [Synergistaceae bacterium]|nr:hypothetical protein [Synergistaceae bacterium]